MTNRPSHTNSSRGKAAILTAILLCLGVAIVVGWLDIASEPPPDGAGDMRPRPRSADAPMASVSSETSTTLAVSPERSEPARAQNRLHLLLLDEASRAPVRGVAVSLRAAASGAVGPADAATAPSAPSHLSGQDGIAVVAPLAAGRYRVDLLDPFFLMTDGASVDVADAGSTPQEHVVLVSCGSCVRGRVVDERSMPVANARVETTVGTGNPFRNAREPLRPRSLSPEAVRLSHTDADGWFELRGCPPGLQSSLGVFHSDHAPKVVAFAAGEAFAVQYLPPIVLDSGVVLQVTLRAGASSTPVADAVVAVGPARGEGWRREVRSGLDGSATLTALPLGKCRITVVARPFAVAETTVSLLADAPNQVALVLSAGSSLSGRIVDTAGTAIANANVDIKFRPTGSDARRSLGTLLGTYIRSGRDGTFATPPLPPGDVSLSAWHGNFAAVHGVRCEVPGPAVQIVLSERRELRGIVRRPDGSPVQQFELQWRPDESPVWLGPKTVRDAGGEFSIPSAETTTLVLATTVEGAGSAALRPPAPGTPAESTFVIVLHPRPRLLGLVIDDATESPIEGAAVTCELGEVTSTPSMTILESLLGGSVLAAASRSDAAGRFEIRPPMPGSALLRIDIPGYEKIEQRIEIESSAMQVAPLRARALQELRGTVQFEDGTPLADSKIYALPIDGSIPVASATTDAAGSFAMRLPPGPHRLWGGGHAPAIGLWQFDTQIADGAAGQAVAVRVEQPAGELTATVTLSGLAVAYARARVVRVGPEPVAPPLWPGVDCETDANGTFRLGRLAAGAYRILVSTGAKRMALDARVFPGRTETVRAEFR